MVAVRVIILEFETETKDLYQKHESSRREANA